MSASLSSSHEQIIDYLSPSLPWMTEHTGPSTSFPGDLRQERGELYWARLFYEDGDGRVISLTA